MTTSTPQVGYPFTDSIAIKCNQCDSLSTTTKYGSCKNCGAPVENKAIFESFPKPISFYIPFELEHRDAKDQFKLWLKRKWFLPNDLNSKKIEYRSFNGYFVPFWTFDLQTYIEYTGEKGIDYTVEKSYRTHENGEWVTKTKTVTKTRWYDAEGQFRKLFSNIFTPAIASTDQKLLEKLSPWEFQNQREFIPGNEDKFRIKAIETTENDALEVVKSNLKNQIIDLINRDIGGDRQRIDELFISYESISSDLILLPVYICSYEFKKKKYQLLINAKTGEVQGQRPYSIIKIILFTFLMVTILIIGLILAQQR